MDVIAVGFVRREDAHSRLRVYKKRETRQVCKGINDETGEDEPNRIK